MSSGYQKSGYEKFFKRAQEARRGESPGKPRLTAGAARRLRSSSRENSSRENSDASKHQISVWKRVPYVPIGILSALVGFLIYSPLNFRDLDRYWKMWEIKAFSLAGASESETKGKESAKSDAKGGEKSGKKSSTEGEHGEKNAEAKGEHGSEGSGQTKTWTPEEIALFKNLERRKLELDQREAELQKMEEELQKQKVELESRLKSLDETRGKIAGQLNERVQSDQEKVERLVSVYTNMKPQNAAKVLQDLNEDLAVEILGKMKQKSAADIMNLMPPDKAQRMTERFAGYKRG